MPSPRILQHSAQCDPLAIVDSGQQLGDDHRFGRGQWSHAEDAQRSGLDARGELSRPGDTCRFHFHPGLEQHDGVIGITRRTRRAQARIALHEHAAGAIVEDEAGVIGHAGIGDDSSDFERQSLGRLLAGQAMQIEAAGNHRRLFQGGHGRPARVLMKLSAAGDRGMLRASALHGEGKATEQATEHPAHGGMVGDGLAIDKGIFHSGQTDECQEIVRVLPLRAAAAQSP